MNFCSNCGNKLNPNSRFCGTCGRPIQKNIENTPYQNKNQNQQKQIEFQQHNKQTQQQYQFQYDVNKENNKQNYPPISNQITETTKNILNSATEHLNKYTGEKGSIDINLKELFSEVFNSHTSEEAEEIFISGTRQTTPPLSQVSENWGKPWLFSRILLWFLIAFVAFWFCTYKLNAPNAIPGFIFAGAFAVPISAMIFYFELNSFKNISIMTTFKMFFIGGAFSILMALILFEIFPLSLESQLLGTLSTADAFLVGIIEEIGKFLIVVYFVTKLDTKYILNGLLIGGAVGAGFAAFETAGYILSSFDEAMSTTIIRGLTAIGGHIAWTAVAGGALIIAKRAEDLQFAHLMKSQFVFFFSSVILMHALWDMDLPINEYLHIAILIIFVWIELFVIINAGLKEITRYKHTSRNT